VLQTIDLQSALTIQSAAFKRAEELGLQPLAVVVLDIRGAVKTYAAQEGTSLLRFEVAHGKAYGALGLGIGSRAIFKRSEQQPSFVNAVNNAAGGALIPVPGGVLIRSAEGTILGAVGISGDTSDNDEICAIAGIQAVNLVADGG